jgi:hypothetical protein
MKWQPFSWSSPSLPTAISIIFLKFPVQVFLKRGKFLWNLRFGIAAEIFASEAFLKVRGRGAFLAIPD